MSKKIIWGFYGVGKSNIKSNLTVIDADCVKFQFTNVTDENLKTRTFDKEYIFNDDYPDNYINYINSANADIVLINCELDLLKHFPKEQLLLVYPDISLKEEYLQRYRDRGDSEAFVRHMAQNFENDIWCIENSPYSKFKITENNYFLNDLLKGDKIMDGFMTKVKIAELFDEAVKYEVFNNEIHGIKRSSPELAQLAFDGVIEVDFNALQKDINNKIAEIKRAEEAAEKARIAKEKALAQEKIAEERRCGYSREELADKIMQGIVNGAFSIYYGMIAPYSHGYEVTYTGDDIASGCKRGWDCYCDLFSIPETIVKSIETNQYIDPLTAKKIFAAVDKKEMDKLDSFIPEKDTDFKRPTRSWERGSIASVKDVHNGKGLDGIVKHHYHGDYSSMTPGAQNSLVETLVYLKGFCLDYLYQSGKSSVHKEKIIEYLKKHGTDISTSQKLHDWIKKNPDKCAFEENRKFKLDSRINEINSSKKPSKKQGRDINNELSK